jgi:lipoteichoic acid synthase
MRSRNDIQHGSGRSRYFLLGRRDWTYVLGLLVPFLAYDLGLKAVRVASLPDEHGFPGSLKLMRSDLLFDLGYALLWIGLFAVARRGLPRALVVLFFHAATILVALITIAAHQFYEVTGSTLGFDTVLFFLSSPGELRAVVASEVTPVLLVVVLATLLYALFGPWLLVRLLGLWRWRTTAQASMTPWLGFVGLSLVAFALLSFSLLPGGGPAGASETFSREAFVNVAMTGIETAEGTAPTPNVDADSVREDLPLKTSLTSTLRTQERNVVIIHLESVGARSVTPYNEDVETTPFLDQLADESLVAERAYAVVPHTTNALVATTCGIDPPLDREQTYSVSERIPARCLPDLLDQEGYDSVYFTSSVKTFERRPEVVEKMGYKEFYPVETMDRSGFQKANYFGYEDDVMLEPSREWLEENADDEPFLATYETITPHHDYLAPDERYGRKEFAEDDVLNRYLNSVRYVDFFVRNLIEQYKDLGLYEETIFVIYGDHGEAFGEHDLYQHDNVPYEEGLRIPMMVHDPQRWRDGERVGELATQLDVLPTVLGLLGYDVEGGAYPGHSLLDLPEDRTLMASCWYDEKCLASVEGTEKYVYHYADRSEEFYDLSRDPLERKNIAEEVAPEELKERRDALLEWRTRVDAIYSSSPSRTP